MKKIFYLAVLLIASASFISAAHAVTIPISMNIPGNNPATTGAGGPGAFVANFYQFALMIGGVLAFGVVVYGGVKYMASAGNPSGQGDAKEWIEAALLGLLLLVGAYFVLNVVNPQLTTLGLPKLVPINIQTPAVAAAPVWSLTNPPVNTAQADCDNYCYLPSTCVQDAGASTWSCKAPADASQNTSNGVACPPGSQNMCVPPNLCSWSPTMIGGFYTCGQPTQQSTPTTVCNGSNVSCPPPNVCVTNNDIRQGWQTCESSKL
jgi:hypothetical protein